MTVIFSRQTCQAKRLYSKPIQPNSKLLLKTNSARKVSQAEKRGAPVYRGPDTKVPRGRLKASVHQSKKFRRYGPGDYSVYVGPSGPIVKLYRAKAEAATGFARTGWDTAAPAMMEAAEAAFRKRIERA